MAKVLSETICLSEFLSQSLPTKRPKKAPTEPPIPTAKTSEDTLMLVPPELAGAGALSSKNSSSAIRMPPPMVK